MEFAEVLIVDDEANIRKALSRELRFKVAAIHTAESGPDALDVLEKENIDLILTDYKMPNMTGAEMLIEAKRRGFDIPAIMLSGQADLSGVTNAINTGVLGCYLDKPWDRDKLLSSVSSVLEKHSPTCDKKTGFGTFPALNEYLKLSCELNKVQQARLLVTVDIMDMNQHNENYGKTVGNEILSNFAAKLSDSVDATWYRVEDKFITFVEHSEKGCEQLIDIIERSPSIELEQGEKVKSKAFVSASETLQNISLEAFGQAKSQAKKIVDGLFWLTPDVGSDGGDEFIELFSLVTDFKRTRLEAFYQPQMTLETGLVQYCEALVRRKLPDGSYQNPSDFLHLVHKYGLDDTLVNVMLQNTLVLLGKIPENCPMVVCLNVTAQQLVSGKIRELLCSVTQNDTNILQCIEVEVVETDGIRDYQEACVEVKKLQELGVKVAIDDFGTGYSGFESLCEIPFDVVKIDGRFIQNMDNCPSDKVILESITNSAKSLNMLLVAEWVEHISQVDYLKEIGCSRIQGHLIGPPKPLDEFLHFLSNYKCVE
ncbi:EAL domain-containing response regulator [Vibrio caribbeanicus]|uniref:Diguanylate cyclase/phosphodiesterase (GGDEF & EAL domains) with PAS/PAC sensor(S) n=1 Tax=Vibrio caribbeanicus ATCC BAA-2122 TaxID=796620 RepID=E3BI35_9VIBR|nr:EAL domain-containing protein [Vibrio caribbeanicus]EFP97474.1 diguanylate cyclase/phosphodiesterase (GGDEF & EAL domains) with PAS/PAC sensor(s) [Vibrio caribbeanicus ATCC BAA-2122]